MAKHEYYGLVPNHILYDKSLTPSEKLVYADISARSNHKRCMWASNTTIADDLGFSPHYVSKTINKYKMLGEFRIEYTGQGGSVRHVYPNSQELRGNSQELPPYSPGITPPNSQELPKDIKNKNINEEYKNPLHPPRGKSGFKPSLDFINEEEWKEVYQLWVNNKKGKFTKQIGVEKGYSHLLKLSNNDLSTAREIIDNSLANNWQGLFSAKSSPGKADKPIYRHGGSINFDL